MPSFKFNFREDQTLSIDEIGLEFTSIEKAYLAAFEAAHDLWPELMRARRDPRKCAFEITDEAGKVLIVLPLSEVLESCRNAEQRRPLSSRSRENVDRMKRLSQELVDQLEQAKNNVINARSALNRLKTRAEAPIVDND
jgi:hypothetical protein